MDLRIDIQILGQLYFAELYKYEGCHSHYIGGYDVKSKEESIRMRKKIIKRFEKELDIVIEKAMVEYEKKYKPCNM